MSEQAAITGGEATDTLEHRGDRPPRRRRRFFRGDRRVFHGLDVLLVVVACSCSW